MQSKPTIKQIFRANRPLWDNSRTSGHVRDAINGMLLCGTPLLGATIYESASGERKEIPFRCKKLACSSCGVRAAINWQRAIGASLPEVPYADVCFTMQSDLWPVLRENRHLVHHIATIAAGALQEWALHRYGADIFVLAYIHTFGKALSFKPHVHMVFATTGLHQSGRHLVRGMRFPKDFVITQWRKTLLLYLRVGIEASEEISPHSKEEILAVLDNHEERLWYGRISYNTSQQSMIRYISRYLRRPPIANSRLLDCDLTKNIRFLTKVTKKGRRPEEVTMPVEQFISLFIEHVADRYRHGPRRFGLAASRSTQKLDAFMGLLRQPRLTRPKPLSFALLSELAKRGNPLLDSHGAPMRRVGLNIPLTDHSSQM